MMDMTKMFYDMLSANASIDQMNEALDKAKAQREAEIKKKAQLEAQAKAAKDKATVTSTDVIKVLREYLSQRYKGLPNELLNAFKPEDIDDMADSLVSTLSAFDFGLNQMPQVKIKYEAPEARGKGKRKSAPATDDETIEAFINRLLN